MVNIVKTIESMATNSGDYQSMKSLKKQLKASENEKNKLKQSSVDPNWRLAPIHAAAKSGSIEVFKLVLGTRGIDTTSVSIMNTCQGPNFYSVLDCAIVEKSNLEIIKLILESDLDLYRTTTDDIPGQKVSTCVSLAVQKGYLEILDLLHSKAKEDEGVDKLSPFLTMMVAIVYNKKEVFTHVLSQAKDEINNRFKTENNEYWTLLDLAKFYKRSEICKELEAEDNNAQESQSQFKRHQELLAMVKTVSPDNLHKEDEDASTVDEEGVKICWNCSRPADATPLLKCKGCRKARYCHDKCQAEDWEVHADYCERKMKKRALKYRN